MQSNRILLAATGHALARAEKMNAEWQMSYYIQGLHVNCLVSDPWETQRVYAGTQADRILVSQDSGKTWQSAGLDGIPVKFLAVSPRQSQTIFAGCKPVSLYVSTDGAESWEEYEGIRHARRWWWFSPADPPGWDPYVMALTISPTDPNASGHLYAGLSNGDVWHTADYGDSWQQLPFNLGGIHHTMIMI